MSDETRDNEGDREQTSRDRAERLSDSTWGQPKVTYYG